MSKDNRTYALYQNWEGPKMPAPIHKIVGQNLLKGPPRAGLSRLSF